LTAHVTTFPLLCIGCIYKNKQYVSYSQYTRDLNM